MIPTNRIDPTGLAMLNYFPLPNFTGTGSQANVVNYFEAASATHPRRNDVLRVDTYLTSKLTGYFRYINDHDDLIALYQGVQFTKGTGGVLGDAGHRSRSITRIRATATRGTVTYSISPTLINEFTVGKSWNTWSYYSLDNYKSIDRSLVNNPATLFPLPTTNLPGVSETNGYQNLMPQLQLRLAAQQLHELHARTRPRPAPTRTSIPSGPITDNLSKVLGKHTIKTGFYIEHNVKIQPAGGGYSGNYNFGPDSINGVNNTGNGYANGLLGYVNSYSQQTARAVFNDLYWNARVLRAGQLARQPPAHAGFRRALLPPDAAGRYQQHLLQFRAVALSSSPLCRASTSPAPAPESASRSIRSTTPSPPWPTSGCSFPTPATPPPACHCSGANGNPPEALPPKTDRRPRRASVSPMTSPATARPPSAAASASSTTASTATRSTPCPGQAPFAYTPTGHLHHVRARSRPAATTW